MAARAFAPRLDAAPRLLQRVVLIVEQENIGDAPMHRQ